MSHYSTVHAADLPAFLPSIVATIETTDLAAFSTAIF
jgi:hypothetical protein